MSGWVILLCAGMVAWAGFIHGVPVRAAAPHTVDQYEVSTGHHDSGSKPVPTAPLTQNHDAQAAGCTAGGCYACGPTPVTAPVTPGMLPVNVGETSIFLTSLPIAPPLRPPTLHA